MRKISLTHQLIYIVLLIIGIISIALGLILPRTLLPIYEDNIYNKLKEPLYFINSNISLDNNNIVSDADIAYLYITKKEIITSSNIEEVIPKYSDDIVNNIKNTSGSFVYNNKHYYYYKMPLNNNIIISITDDTYLTKLKSDIIYVIFLVVGISFVLSSGILILWSNNLVNNIKILKKKIKTIDNYDKNIKSKHYLLDEIYELDTLVDSMKTYLKNNELYKNQMYQNISHDFKTPIAVIKSYIEAIDDQIETKEHGLKIIKEQTDLLENKVHSLLYLNKLNYLKENSKNIKSQIQIENIIKSSVAKFKIIRPDIEYELNLDSKMKLRGTIDMWEAIIDNLLNNFMRYTEKQIKITAKNKKIILYNDGKHIDPSILNNIFTPYKKGLNGMFGLGLSIVKESLSLLNYKIDVKNVKNGVNFIIK